MRLAARRVARLAAFLCATIVVACGPRTSPLSPVYYAVEISNATSFSIDVFTVTSPGATPRRIASAIGSGTTKIRIPQDAVQASGDLVLALHAIGSSSTWSAPPILVDVGSTIRVEVFASPSGYLGRSSVYLVANDTT